VLRRIQIIASDFRGLIHVCGWCVALRWLAAIFIRFPACQRAGNLQPADAAIGDGPIRVRKGNARAMLGCERVLTGIRETWVRDEYLGGGYLRINPDALVVDLGANMGGVTALALAHGPQVRVMAVEADPNECRRFEKTMALNGWSSRARLINAFVGGRTRDQEKLLATDRASDVPTISQGELLALTGGKIDFLKCDIEGSEFELCAGGAPLLAAAEQIAMEVHPHAGDANGLVDFVKGMGFEVRVIYHAPTVMLLARRPERR